MAITNTTNVPLPAAGVAATDKAIRGGKYGEQMILHLADGRINLADEGSYFVACNPTPGTGYTVAASTALQTLDYTKATFSLLNNASAGGKRVYMDYIKLIATVAGVAMTSIRYVIQVDNGVGRWTSGSTITANNVNMDSAVGSGCAISAAPVVCTAATAAARLVANGVFKTGAAPTNIVGDTHILTFGSAIGGVGSAVATINTDIYPCPPVIIGPQQSFFFYTWYPAITTACAWEFEIAWWER